VVLIKNKKENLLWAAESRPLSERTPKGKAWAALIIKALQQEKKPATQDWRDNQA